MNTTIVSAFFVLPDEHSHPMNAYSLWAGRLLRQIRAPIILTASQSALSTWLAPHLQERKRSGHPTVVSSREVERLYAVRRYRHPRPQGRSRRRFKHSAFYGFVQHEKVSLLLDAATANRFGTTHFLWCDLGLWRVPHQFEHWPAPAALVRWPAARVLALQVYIAFELRSAARREMRVGAMGDGSCELGTLQRTQRRTRMRAERSTCCLCARACA